MDEQRRLLDELMGQERNLEESQKQHRVRHFSDENVCKYYLAGLSPYFLFKNTKSDLGEYNKIVDDDCRAEFQKLPQSEKDKYGYEYDLQVLLERQVQQCDARVKKHADRIKAEHHAELEAIAKALNEEELKRMGEIEDEIAVTEGGEGVEGSALELGVSGRVDEAMAALNRAESLRREYQTLEKKALDAARETSGRKSMLVCDVSGNFMNATDNGERLRCHFEGKQYQGWKLIREKLKELQRNRPPPRGGSYKSSSTSGVDRDRDPNRERDRGRDRDRGDRDRDRSRSDRGDRRDYDRRDDRGRDDRSRERRRSRSRSRDRPRR
mmetsp:Transcript_50221/g.113972  ORF Transcript_50221/g.113972 Transcript_50221/m.113972 type:complete len:325 (-) Transcript_50221:162-1136(-)